MNQSDHSRGIVLAVSPRYEYMARRAIASIRRVNPEIPVHRLPAADGIDSRIAKLSMAELSPFEQSLFVDCDVMVVRPLDAIWELLEEHHLWMSVNSGPRTARQTWKHHWYRRTTPKDYLLHLIDTVPPETIHFNSGVILFDRRAEAFFADWKSRWLKWGPCRDQLPLMQTSATYPPPRVLPGKWHRLVGLSGGLERARDGHIYHFHGHQKHRSFVRWKKWMNLQSSE